ncbi:MAG: Methyl-accepting chemotaxis protein [Pseudomonadota bacterium]|jgi:methyl-accepting chemotaxis protein
MFPKFSSIGIALKIMVAPAIISFLLLIFGLYSHWNMSVTQKQIEDLNQATQAERSAQELQSIIHQTHASVYRSFSMIAMKQPEKAKELMSQRLQAVDEMIRMYDADEALKKDIQIEPVKTYFTNAAEAFDAALSDPNLGAMMMQSADDSYDQTITMLQGVTTVSRIKANNANDEFAKSLEFMKRTQAVVLLLAVALGLLVAYLAGKRIAKPLLLMKEKLVEIAKTGRFDQRIAVLSKDEVGQTAEAANALMGNLQSSFRSVNSALSGLAAGEFDATIDTRLQGDLGEMMQAVQTTVDSVRNTMNGLDQLMNAMSHGNFSVDMAIQAQGAYQRTATQAQTTIVALRDMLGDVGQVLDKMAAGDLTARVSAQGQGDLAHLKANINSTLDSLSKAFGSIHHNARQVASAAAQTSQAIGQISDGAQNQTHAISQVSAAVRQTAESVSDVSQNTEIASQKSRHSVQVLRNGLSKIEKMVEVVNSIASNSEKINKITEVIEKIANKTNLLSLNAAIEAARAGEHGKGFAVVADEVGKLAVSSAESSKEIALLVQQAVLDTVQAVAAVKEVSHDMSQIELGTQETDQMLMRIAQALEEQNSAVREINQNLMNLDGISRSNSAASEEITATVMELSKLADATRHQAEMFKV